MRLESGKFSIETNVCREMEWATLMEEAQLWAERVAAREPECTAKRVERSRTEVRIGELIEMIALRLDLS